MKKSMVGVWCRMSGEGLVRTGGGRRGLVEEDWSKWPKLEAQTRQSVSVYAGPGRELENWSRVSDGGDPLHKLNWDLGEMSFGGRGSICCSCHRFRGAEHSYSKTKKMGSSSLCRPLLQATDRVGHYLTRCRR